MQQTTSKPLMLHTNKANHTKNKLFITYYNYNISHKCDDCFTKTFVVDTGQSLMS